MSKLWRCYNCPTEDGLNWEEWQGEAKCPKCGLTPKDKIGGERVVERTAIHLDPPHAVVSGRGTGVRPCDGKAVGLGSATGSASAVTCPECLKTLVFKDLAEVQGLDIVTTSEADFIVEGPKEVPSGS